MAAARPEWAMPINEYSPGRLLEFQRVFLALFGKPPGPLSQEEIEAFFHNPNQIVGLRRIADKPPWACAVHADPQSVFMLTKHNGSWHFAMGDNAQFASAQLRGRSHCTRAWAFNPELTTNPRALVHVPPHLTVPERTQVYAMDSEHLDIGRDSYLIITDPPGLPIIRFGHASFQEADETSVGVEHDPTQLDFAPELGGCPIESTEFVIKHLVPYDGSFKFYAIKASDVAWPVGGRPNTLASMYHTLAHVFNNSQAFATRNIRFKVPRRWPDRPIEGGAIKAVSNVSPEGMVTVRVLPDDMNVRFIPPTAEDFDRCEERYDNNFERGGKRNRAPAHSTKRYTSPCGRPTGHPSVA